MQPVAMYKGPQVDHVENILVLHLETRMAHVMMSGNLQWTKILLKLVPVVPYSGVLKTRTVLGRLILPLTPPGIS